MGWSRFIEFKNDINDYARVYRFACICFVHVISIAVAAMLTSSAFAIDLFVAINGDDGNEGRTLDQALATLDKALGLALSSQDLDGSRIILGPGTYSRQSTNIKITRSFGKISIEPLDPEKRPVFDGESRLGTWLRIKSTAAQSADLPLTIIGMEIKRYRTAISIEGATDSQGGEVKGVVITSNAFEEIGTFDDDKPSTAAVRFVNVQNSKIAGNVFRNIQNLRDCKLLHPIYLAHNSTNNLIQDNTFDKNCGYAIKFRDSSDNNVIKGNHFINQVLRKYVQDWYCDSTRRSDCMRMRECPSWGNRFLGNIGPMGRPVGGEVIESFNDKGLFPNCQVPDHRHRFITTEESNSP